MSIPVEANGTSNQATRVPDSTLTDLHVEAANYDVHPGKSSPYYDEYTTLLKKHLGVVENELGRLKGSQSTKPGANHTDGTSTGTKAGATEMQAQEAGICRVPPWQWREVKNELTINPKSPTLIASSKGYGMVGRRANERRSTRHRGTPGDGSAKHQQGASFDLAYRLAINSKILLEVLGDCTGKDFPEDRNVWLRPFKYLVAYETEIRQALEDAEATINLVKADSDISDRPASGEDPNAMSTSFTTPTQAKSKDFTNVSNSMSRIGAIDAPLAKAERDQLRCLVDFMESDMQDIFEIKGQVASQTLEEIGFEHLWLLYRSGDLVYTMKSLEDSGIYQAFRVLHVTGGRPILDTLNKCGFNAIHDRNWEEDSDTEEKARDTIRGSPSDMTPLIIDCFSIEFDGSRLGPRCRRFVIPKFTGKRKVDALELCPSFSHPQHENIRRDLVRRGRRFTQLAIGTHKRYSGTTLRESRELWESHNYYWNYVIHDEEIHSEVMLDQSAAVTHYRKAFEKWRLKIGGRLMGVPTAPDRREVFDPLPIKLDEDLQSDVFDDSIIDLDRRNDFINTTTLLKYHRDLLDPSLSDDYVMLLPYRIYGYAMLNRKWFPLDINKVDDLTADHVRMTAAGYEDLVLPEGHKNLLQAIVKNQVRNPKLNSSGSEENPDEFQMDVVKGKGKGLIILLHGAPGVGKTSTAECVAAQLRRPLLPITCGDVSTNVKQAEATLQEYCALAHRWRCVLLLDEADVFLAKREKGDIARNGLVSGC